LKKYTNEVDHGFIADYYGSSLRSKDESILNKDEKWSKKKQSSYFGAIDIRKELESRIGVKQRETFMTSFATLNQSEHLNSKRILNKQELNDLELRSQTGKLHKFKVYKDCQIL